MVPRLVRTRGSEFSPVVARLGTIHRPLGPRAFDCAQLAVVRAGSAILFGKFGDHYLNIGDVALISPCTLFRVEPEPWVTITTLYVDNDYLVDQIFWQYATHFTDRLDTQTFLDAQDTDPIHVVRLGENRASLLTPWLDELTALSTNGLLPERFYRLQALLFSIFDIVVPTLDDGGIVPCGRTSVLPRLPRRRAFSPVQEEARLAARMLRDGLAEEWTLDRLAASVHLSRSRLGRVFREAFGKTPIAYLTMLRAERMAELLRTTDAPIATIASQLGWPDPDYAGRLFKQSVGYSPRQYRALSRRIPAAE